MMDDLERKAIKGIRSYQPGKPIEELKRESGISKIYKLASNENSLGPSPRAIKAIEEELSNINRYPEPSCYRLKTKLAARLGVKRENLVVGNGSDEIITLCLKAFLNPGEEVIVARPTFLIYSLAARIAGAVVREVPLKDFRYDLKAFLNAVNQKTRIIFIANPDNPTGTYVNEETVAAFMKSLPANVLVYFDEAYYEFVDNEDFPQCFKYLDTRNAIIARTFSKAYGLAGLRVGYGIARPEIISSLDKVREPFNVNRLAQVAALAALEDDKFLAKSKQMVSKAKDYLYPELDKLGLRFVESSTNFIFVDMGRTAKPVVEKLLKWGIIIRDLEAWGLSNFARITVGTSGENEKLVRALRYVVEHPE
jgi:histidinol-phosphate aminotransferase